MGIRNRKHPKKNNTTRRSKFLERRNPQIAKLSNDPTVRRRVTGKQPTHHFFDDVKDKTCTYGGKSKKRMKKCRRKRISLRWNGKAVCIKHFVKLTAMNWRIGR